MRGFRLFRETATFSCAHDVCASCAVRHALSWRGVRVVAECEPRLRGGLGDKNTRKKRTAAAASKYDDASGVGAVRVRRLAGRRCRRRRVRRPPAPLRRRRRESIKYRQLHTPARARVPCRRCFRTRARISTAAARLSATEFSAIHIPRGGGT
uniref:Uncharacterized protein n=1 Tax=Schizaphis graminum TaxID=13262 RepID=A0A2S2PD10_SCHGA